MARPVAFNCLRFPIDVAGGCSGEGRLTRSAVHRGNAAVEIARPITAGPPDARVGSHESIAL